MKIRCRILILSCCLLAAAVQPAAAVWVGGYFPMCLGATWYLGNIDIPGDFYVESVFELIEYEGHPAMRYGEGPSDHSIIGYDMQSLTLYAEVEDGVLIDLAEDLVLGDMSDGDRMILCFDAPCDTNMVRFWENIDPGLRSIYGLDPEVTDLFMIVSYDPDYDPNLNNTILESNLPAGVTPPTGAVTGIEWYRWHAGIHALFDVDAESGGLYNRTFLIDFTAPVPDGAAPARVTLAQNHPNPFNPATVVGFALERPTAVTLTVFDCAGRIVRVLANGAVLDEGAHTRTWDGRDDTGREAPSGTYVCYLRADDVRLSCRMTLVR